MGYTGDLVATPSDKARVVVHRILYMALSPGDDDCVVSSGSTIFMKILGAAINSIIDTGFIENGIECPIETALSVNESDAVGLFYITWSIN
jgi:hypothetical protein